MVGFLVSFIFLSYPKNIGLITNSDLVSLISKCKCGPSDEPVLPESAINCPFVTGNSPGFGNISISNAFSL